MFSSKYDTSAMRIHMEFTRKAAKRLGRVNQRKGEKLLPDQIIREMAEYIEHRMEDGDAMIAEFTVRFDGDVFHWRGELIRDVLAGKVPRARLGRGFDGRRLPLSHNFFAEHLSKHAGANESDPRNAPLSRSDYELLPTIWRSPDRISKSGDRDHLELDALDGGVLHLFVSPTSGIRSFYKARNPGGA